MNTPQDAFNLLRRVRDELTGAGLVLRGEPDCSGELITCGTTRKPNGTDGRYAVHLDEPANVWLINYHEGGEGRTIPLWKQGELDAMTATEREKLRARIRQEKEEAKKKAEKCHRKATEASERVFRPLPPAGEENAYLKRKGVIPRGDLRQTSDGRLVVPVRNAEGRLLSLQFMDGEGGKRFLSGGRIKGGFFPVPAKNGSKDGPLLIGEGVATVLSACQATGYAGLTAFDCGNLLPVAEAARKLYPTREIVLLADNDVAREGGNIGVEKATEAARAVGGKLAIPPAHEGRSTDFNDLHVWRSLEAVRLVIEEAMERENLPSLSDEWPTPIPFAAHNLPKLEPRNLPPVLGEFCAELAEEKQVPVEIALAMSLSVLATAAQDRFMVRIREGYVEPVNLYILCPLEPANRKSAVVETCTAPLRAWEKDMAASMAPRVKEARSARQTLEKVIEGKRAKAVKAAGPTELEDLQREIRDLEEKLPTVPKIPRLLADNTTPEALAVLMEDMGGCIGILTPEGGIFDILSGLYSKGIPNLDLFLKAHSGDSFRVDRRNAPPVLLDAPRLTLGISPQPITLEERSAARLFRGRGLDARFLYFMPESLLGRRNLEPAPMNPATKEQFHRKVRALLPLQWEEERPQPVVLELSEDAYRHWLSFAGEVEKGLAPGGEFEGMNDWGGKLAGAVARVAGLFHLVTHERPQEVKILLETMRQATYLGGLLTEHAKAAYALMGTDDTIEGAKKALAWIRRQAVERFSVRDCFNGVRQQVLFSHVEAVNVALKELEERGFIRELPTERHGVGRKPSPVYQVNPATLKG